MATINIFLNDVNVTEHVNARTQNIFACVLGTDNITSDTVMKGVKESGKLHDESDTVENIVMRAEQYATTLLQAGNANDVFRVTQIVSKSGAQGEKVMTATREAIVNRFRVALYAEKYAVKIVNPEFEKIAGSKTDKVIQDVVVI